MALNGLSHIVTPDLAQHLAPDIVSLLSHTKPSIRKKAISVMHAMIVHYPPILDQALPRLNDKLGDQDASVVSATVNIICELARHDVNMAKSFLPLSPHLFDLLTTSTNNWMLIKIVKLFGVLTPLEPRLARRLLPPVSAIIKTTPAMSLLYECMHTVILGGMLFAAGGDDLAALCSEKFGAFLDDEDQNLRYIALLGLVKILPTHPYLVSMHQERIFDSMDDEDLSIRLRALDLVSGMATRENFMDIVQQQLKCLEPGSISANQSASTSSAAQSLRHIISVGGAPQPSAGTSSASWISASYRLEIINRILDTGSQDTYTNIIDFEWYIDTLIRLNYLAGDSVGMRVSIQLIDIAARVQAVRPHAIEKLKRVLEDPSLIESVKSTQELEIVRAAAWICGEYCQDVSYPPAVILLLLRGDIFAACSDRAVAVVVQNAIKLFAWWLLDARNKWKAEKLDEVSTITSEVASALEQLMTSPDPEIQERSCEFCLLIQLLQADLASCTRKDDQEAEKDGNEQKERGEPPKSLQLLSPLFFVHALGPVAKKAQSKVAVPGGLNLQKPFVGTTQYHIIDLWDDTASTKPKKGKLIDSSVSHATAPTDGLQMQQQQQQRRQLEKLERARLRAEREKRQRESPFYIGAKSKTKAQDGASSTEGNATNSKLTAEDDNVDSIPIVQLQLDDTHAAQKASTPSGGPGECKPTTAKTKPQLPQQEQEEVPDNETTAAAPDQTTLITRKTVKSRASDATKKKKRRAKGVNEAMLE